MVHIFNKKSDFELMLNMAATRLSGTLKKYWNCNSRIYLWYIESASNNPDFVSKITFIGFSSDTFSDSRQGLFFGENTEISEIRKEFSYVANQIEKCMSNDKSIHEFQIGG
jgi:hypothetical protein